MTLSLSSLILTLGVVYGYGVHGATVKFNWTSDGVEPYRSYINPLRMKLGDQLIFLCGDKISNLFIQTDQAQYESCNANAGSGVFNYNGFCLPHGSLMLTLTENSRSLSNTVNFENNSIYYLTSYSNGTLRHLDDTINSGGQCDEGVKMIIVIGDADIDIPTAGTSQSTATDQEGGNKLNILWLYIAIPVIFVLILVTVVVVVIITAIFIKAKYFKKSDKVLNFAESIYSIGRLSFHDGLDMQEKGQCSNKSVIVNELDLDTKQTPGPLGSSQETTWARDFNYTIVTVETFGLEHQNTAGSPNPNSETSQTPAAVGRKEDKPECTRGVERCARGVERYAKPRSEPNSKDIDAPIYMNTNPPKHLLETTTPIYQNCAEINPSKSNSKILGNNKKSSFSPRQIAAQTGKARKSKSTPKNIHITHKR